MSYTFNELRNTYKNFVYKNFEITQTPQDISVVYDFEIEGLAEFHPTWVFPKPFGKSISNDKIFKELVFSLGMVELVSYWKISCPENVKVLCGKLESSQIEFWKSLYYSGLGEFFYKNEIKTDMDSFMNIQSFGNAQTGEFLPIGDNDKCLIAVGGGKDSIVSLEVLRSNFDNNYCFIINPRGATLDCAKTAGYDDSHIIAMKRTLDKNMLELNKQGYLNGHTPFSAIVAFSSVIGAYLFGIKNVVLSNEASANESTVKNSDVNHQYSKSFKFEKDFNDYERDFVKSGVFYFSLLRPMSELQIAKYFATKEKYHSVFQSCNVGSKENRWCADCSKCLFVSIILSPFLSMEKLGEIFGKNMLEQKDMEKYFTQLVGIGDEKPFECVGSRDEINTAICMAIKRLESQNERLPYLFEIYKNLDQYEIYKDRKNPFDNYYNSENLLPEKFKQLLLKECYDSRQGDDKNA